MPVAMADPDDWRDLEIQTLRDEVRRLREQVRWLEAGAPMQRWEMRERGLDVGDA